jgi:cytochrome c oxidase subunit 2
MKDTTAPGLTIKVTGNQWSWNYDYLQEGFGYYSNLATPTAQIENRAPKGEHYLLEVDHELVVPSGKKVRIITTAADVVHAWWIPAMGAKQDAIPGFLRDTWFRAEQTGTFRGQCVELCGKEHGFMPIVLRVVSPADYSKWVGEQKKAMAAAADDPSKTWELKDLVARGERVYAANCVACHQAAGQGTPAMKAPALAGSKFVTGAEEGPIDTVLNGRPNTAMQSFKGQLSDTDIAAVLSYTRNSWGNKASDVQPAEVKARRK